MKGVYYGNLQLVLNVSGDKWSEIKVQYQSDEQRCEAMIAHALSTHPCMSWKLIARGLQRCGYSEVAAEVTKKYVKGQLRTTWYINADPCTVSSDFLSVVCCTLSVLQLTHVYTYTHTRIYIFLYTTASQSVAIYSTAWA